MTELSAKAQATRQRLLDAAIGLFAERGYEGTSVRDSCRAAEISINMVHHYFGNKAGLRQKIIDGFAADVFDLPLAIIEPTTAEPDPQTAAAFAERFERFFAATLESLNRQRLVYAFIVREQASSEVLGRDCASLIDFLERAQRRGVIHERLDPEMITGAILDRLGNQVLYANWIETINGSSILTDAAYKARWMKAHQDLFLYGVLA